MSWTSLNALLHTIHVPCPGKSSLDKLKKCKRKLRYRVVSLNTSSHFNKLINPLSAKKRKWPNTLKQFVGNLLTNCVSVFVHFVGLALKGFIRLIPIYAYIYHYSSFWRYASVSSLCYCICQTCK